MFVASFQLTAQSAAETAAICFRQSRKDLGRIHSLLSRPEVGETVRFLARGFVLLAEICYLTGKATRTSMESFIVECQQDVQRGNRDVAPVSAGANVGSDREVPGYFPGPQSGEHGTPQCVGSCGDDGDVFATDELAAALDLAEYVQDLPALSLEVDSPEVQPLSFWVALRQAIDGIPEDAHTFNILETIREVLYEREDSPYKFDPRTQEEPTDNQRVAYFQCYKLVRQRRGGA